MSNNDLSVFSFRNNGGTAQYSMNSGSSWTNFKNPTGTRSITTNGTYDVTNYASASVNVSASVSWSQLYSNSSPTSQQSSGVVNLTSGSFSSYSYLKFTFRRSTSDSTQKYVIIPKEQFTSWGTGTGGSKGRWSSPLWLDTSATIIYRSFNYYSDTSIYLFGATPSNNSNWILVGIYGTNANLNL